MAIKRARKRIVMAGAFKGFKARALGLVRTLKRQKGGPPGEPFREMARRGQAVPRPAKVSCEGKGTPATAAGVVKEEMPGGLGRWARSAQGPKVEPGRRP